MPTNQPTFTVHHANPSNLPSLSTIVPRAFHPTNAYILQLWPNTLLIQQWWTKVFASKISHPPASHLLTVTSATNPTTSLGVLSLQRFSPSERGAGLYTTFSPTADHDAAAFRDVGENLGKAREELMTGREHLVIELFGVDHGFKGYGLGKLLLSRACEIADEAGLPVFVMANASAQGIYPRHGFELRDVKVMPGELEYEEFMLVRQPENRS